MRPLGTWVVIGALALIGLFAARDALRGEEAPASSPAVQRLERRPHQPPAVAKPPQVADKDRLAAELQALGAGGVLYLTDANCRRYLLGLPALLWTTAQGLPGPVCTSGGAPRTCLRQRSISRSPRKVTVAAPTGQAEAHS
jgi:hypothetical protein